MWGYPGDIVVTSREFGGFEMTIEQSALNHHYRRA
jgi:hypothetical protein